MPLLDIGYRNWNGPRTPRWSRALVLATNGIHLVWKGTWLKRVLLFMVVPALIAGVMVAAFEQVIDRSGPRALFQGMARNPAMRDIATRSGVDLQKAAQDPESFRHFFWSFVLFYLSRYPQALGMIVVLGLVAPRLISYDLRSRGYLLYLSRPLTPGEYVLGKAIVVYFLLFMMAAVPALLIYVAGLFLSTDSAAISQTWDIPARIILASLILMIPTTAVALAFSSMTQESRFAGFAWFSLWVIGGVTYQVLWFANEFRQPQPNIVFEGGGRGGRAARIEAMSQWSDWKLFSPYETLGYMQQQIFGLTDLDGWIVSPWILMIAVSIIGYGIAYWRVSRVLRA